MHSALERGGVPELHYQPKISTSRTDAWTGAEALDPLAATPRWGWCSPGDFIPDRGGDRPDPSDLAR